MFLVVLGTIIHFLVLKTKVQLVFYILLVLAAPNAFGFIFVLGVNSGFSRKIYTYILAIKLAVISFLNPVVFLYVQERVTQHRC
jgi:hypothetical protein